MAARERAFANKGVDHFAGIAEAFGA